MECPEHNLEMYYHEPTDTVACQNIDCKYGHGISVKDIQWQTTIRTAKGAEKR